MKNQKKMNKEDFLKEFKREKLEQSENPKKQKTKINFTNPFKKSKDKKTKKKRTWVKVLTNLFLLAIMLLCSFAIFAVNGFNMDSIWLLIKNI